MLHSAPTAPRFVKYLQNRQKRPLPGQPAQMKMSPRAEANRLEHMPDDGSTRRSAVLILLYPDSNGSLFLLFTLRSNNLRTHKGQISFPGGRMEPGESSRQTALRETEEEVGIARDSIEVLGSTSNLYVSASNSLVTPIVGYIAERPEFTPEPSEVEEIIEVDLDRFLDPGIFQHHYRTSKEVRWKVPTWNIHKTTPLWGATAMMLSEFLEIYREFLATSD